MLWRNGIQRSFKLNKLSLNTHFCLFRHKRHYVDIGELTNKLVIFLLSSGIWETIIRKEMERRERGEEREHIEFQQQREGRKGDAAPFKPLLKFEPCLLCCIVSIASSAKGGIVLASREQKFHFDSQWGFDSFPFLFSEASLHLRNEPFFWDEAFEAKLLFFPQRQQRRPKNAAEKKLERGA